MKLQDYLHYYMGCKMTHKDHVGEPYILHFEVIRSAVDHGDMPILRRLEDMTEDEMIRLLQSMTPADMEDRPIDEDYNLEMFYNDDGLMVDADISVGANFTCRCFDGQIGVKKCGSIILFEEGEDVTRDQLINTPMAFHYLLQQHFDLFGLIDVGLAVAKQSKKRREHE